MRRCVTTYAATLDEIQAGLGDAARLSLPRLERSNATSQARRLIIGAGFGSTATHTLTHALGVLKLEASHDHTSPMRNGIKFPAATRSWRSGFNRFRHPRFRSGPGLASCMDELHTMDVTAGLEYVDAVVDMPTAEFFLPLFAAFPNARVILTTRSGSSWAASRLKKHPETFAPYLNPCGQRTRDYEASDLARMTDAHADFVRCAVAPERLFEFNVSTPPRINTLALARRINETAGFLAPTGRTVLDDADCYASQYDDLLASHCSGSLSLCDKPRLREHWATTGKLEGRTFGCVPVPHSGRRRRPSKTDSVGTTQAT